MKFDVKKGKTIPVTAVEATSRNNRRTVGSDVFYSVRAEVLSEQV
jgi:hypothetical protein